MGIPKGTKLTDSPKDRVLRIRIDKETEEQLETVCNLKGKTKSEVVRDGIEQQYQNLKK